MSDDQQKLANLVAAADSGNLDACYELGFSYHSGLLGLPVDFQLARSLYERAIKHEPPHATALNNLGVMNNAGQGCALNGRKAAQFFLRAAVRGHTMAMRNLAHILAEGRASSATPGQIESDDDQDEDEALNSRNPAPVRLSRRLSHLLDTNHSAFQTGQVSRNINMALHWFDKAAAAGDHEGYVDAEKLMRNEFPRLMFLHQRGSIRPRHHAFLGECCIRLLPESAQSAVYFFECAAASGYIPSIQRLIDIYDNGLPSLDAQPNRALQCRELLALVTGNKSSIDDLLSRLSDESRVVYAAAFAGDMKSQLKLGAKHELDRPSANLRLALAWFLRAATHPVVAKLAPTSEVAETAEISMVSAALGAIPASSVFQSLVISSDETPAPNRAWWHSTPGSRSVVLPQIGSEDPLSSYVPVSVDAQPAPFLVAVSPPESLPVPQPAASFETSVRISETPLPTSSILPRLSFIRNWSQVLHASGSTEAPHSAVLKANMSVWFPFGATVDPVDRVSEVAFAAQAANNAAAILDRIEQQDIWRRVPASVSQMLLSNQLKPDTASSSSSFPSFSTLSTPVRASRSSQSSNQLPVDDHESASVASVSVWPCASAACLLLSWASALGLSAARRNLGSMFAAGRSGFARVSWVNREPIAEASVETKPEVPVPEVAVQVEPAVDLNQSIPIPSISISTSDPKPAHIADALVVAHAATDASPMLRSETVGASVPKDVVLATHLLAAALALSNGATDSADIESSLLRLVPPSTVAHFLAAIRDDSIDAQLAVAQMYELGELTSHVNNVVLAASSKLPGVTSCASAAQYWYQRALVPRSNDVSIKRQARAACRLAVLLDNQIISSLNAAKTHQSDSRQDAIGLFRWAAAAGDAWAFKFLGSIVQHGRPAASIVADAEKALLLYVRSVKVIELTITGSQGPSNDKFVVQDVNACLKSALSAIVALWPRIQRIRIDREIEEYCACLQRAEGGDAQSMLAMARSYFRGPRTFAARAPVVETSALAELNVMIQKKMSELTAFLHRKERKTPSKTEKVVKPSAMSPLSSTFKSLSRSFSEFSISRPATGMSSSIVDSRPMTVSSSFVRESDLQAPMPPPWTPEQAELYCTACLPWSERPSPWHPLTDPTAIAGLLAAHGIAPPPPPLPRGVVMGDAVEGSTTGAAEVVDRVPPPTAAGEVVASTNELQDRSSSPCGRDHTDNQSTKPHHSGVTTGLPGATGAQKRISDQQNGSTRPAATASPKLRKPGDLRSSLHGTASSPSSASKRSAGSPGLRSPSQLAAKALTPKKALLTVTPAGVPIYPPEHPVSLARSASAPLHPILRDASIPPPPAHAIGPHLSHAPISIVAAQAKLAAAAARPMTPGTYMRTQSTFVEQPPKLVAHAPAGVQNIIRLQEKAALSSSSTADLMVLSTGLAARQQQPDLAVDEPESVLTVADLEALALAGYEGPVLAQNEAAFHANSSGQPFSPNATNRFGRSVADNTRAPMSPFALSASSAAALAANTQYAILSQSSDASLGATNSMLSPHFNPSSLVPTPVLHAPAPLPHQAFVQSFSRAYEWLRRLQSWLRAQRRHAAEVALSPPRHIVSEWDVDRSDSDDEIDDDVAAAVAAAEKDERDGDTSESARLRWALQTHCWALIAALRDQGWAMQRDTRRAVAGFRKAAARGDTFSMRNLGLIYQFGRHGVVEPDLGAALLWYERAALGGNLQARSLLLQTLPSRLADCWSRAISGTDAAAHRECSVLYSEGWSLASMSESSSTLMRKHIRPHIHLTYEWVQRALIQAARNVDWPRFVPVDSSADILSLQCKPFSLSQPLGDEQKNADIQSEHHEHSLMNLLFCYSTQLEVATVRPISKQSSLDQLPTRGVPLLTASASAMLSPTESKSGDFRMVPPSLLSTSGHLTIGPDGQFESGVVSTTSNLLETTLQLPRVEPIDSRPGSRGFNNNTDATVESTVPSIPLVVTESELPLVASPEPRQISTAAARMSESASHRRLMLSSPMSISRPGTAQTLRAHTAAKDAVAALSSMKKAPPTVEDLDLELELSQHGRFGSHTAFLLSALLLAGTSTSIAISSQLTTPSSNLTSPVGSNNLFHLESVWARCAIHLIAHLRRAAHIPAAPPSVLNDPFANGLKPHFHSQIEFSDYAPFSPAQVLLGSRLVASTAASLPPANRLWVDSVVRLAELYSTPAPVADDELEIDHVGRKDSIPSDPLRAFCLRQIAAASGQASEMRLIGQTHLDGLSIALPEAARLLHKRPSTSSPALNVLKPNVVLAAEWFAEATAAGDAQARTALRQLMSTPIADLMEQAIAGDVDSQFALGLIYDTGHAALVQFPQTLAESQIANADSNHQYIRSVISDGAPSIVHVRIAPGLPLPSRPATRSSPSPLPGKASPTDFSPLKSISPPRRNLHSRSRSVASPPSAAKLASNQKPIHFIDDSAVGVRSSLWAINSKALDGHTAQSSDTVLFGLETRPPGVVVCAAAAWHWYSRAAARGHAGAKNNLALMALTSMSQASDTPDRALKLLNEAAQAGCAPAMFNLGLHFLNRPEPIAPVEIVEPDMAAAATVVMPAVADVGPTAPELKLDNIQKPKVSEARKTDLALSCDWFQAAADTGLARAWAKCAVVHQAIDAIAADEEESMLAALVQQWLQNSNVAAAYELGVAFADAIAPVRVSNPIRALEWFERAALVNASVVQSKLVFPITLSIVDGIDDGPEDHESELVFESIGFVDDIKLMRHVGACLRLGLIRDQGDCCDPDAWAAVRAFRWAASRRGSAEAAAAARQLGLLFSVGRQGQHAISPDEYAAVRWMMRAAIVEDAQAKALLAEWMGQEVYSTWQRARAGDLEACLKMGQYHRVGVEHVFRANSARSVAWFTKLIELDKAQQQVTNGAAGQPLITDDLTIQDNSHYRIEALAAMSLTMMDEAEQLDVKPSPTRANRSGSILKSSQSNRKVTSPASFSRSPAPSPNSRNRELEQKARTLLGAAAAAGHPAAMRRLAQQYLANRISAEFENYASSKEDYNKLMGVLWLTRAAALGSTEAWDDLCANVTEQHAQMFLDAFNVSDPEAQYELALLLDRGTAQIPSAPSAAFAFFAQAAMSGHVGALTNVGVCFDVGRGVTQNATVALECFTRAAAAGNLMACKNLGVLHEQGREPLVPSNHVKAMEWYMHAASQGHLLSLIALRRMALQHPDLGLDADSLESLISEQSASAPGKSKPALGNLSSVEEDQELEAESSVSSAPPAVLPVVKRRRLSISEFFSHRKPSAAPISTPANRSAEEIKAAATSLATAATDTIAFINQVASSQNGALPVLPSPLASPQISMRRSVRSNSAAAAAIALSVQSFAELSSPVLGSTSFDGSSLATEIISALPAVEREVMMSNPFFFVYPIFTDAQSRQSSEFISELVLPPSACQPKADALPIVSQPSPLVQTSSTFENPSTDVQPTEAGQPLSESAQQQPSPIAAGEAASFAAVMLTSPSHQSLAHRRRFSIFSRPNAAVQVPASTTLLQVPMSPMPVLPAASSSTQRMLSVCQQLVSALTSFSDLRSCPPQLLTQLERVVGALDRAKMFLLSQSMRTARDKEVEEVLAQLLVAQRNFSRAIEDQLAQQLLVHQQALAEKQRRAARQARHATAMPDTVQAPIETSSSETEVLSRFGELVMMVDMYRVDGSWDSRILLPNSVHIEMHHDLLQNTKQLLSATAVPLASPAASNEPTRHRRRMSSVTKPPQLRARVVPFALSQVTMSSHSLKPIMSRIDSILATELPDDWLVDAQRLKLVGTGNLSHAAPVRGEVSRVFCDTMDSDRPVAVRHLNKLVDLVPANSDSTPAPESRLIAAVIRQEAALMRRLAEGSPRFVNFIGIVTVSSESRVEQPAVVLEWMSRGSLHQCIFGNDDQHGIADENAEAARMHRLPPMVTLIRIAVQIAEGLRYLHLVVKTVHRSLSSHHVLLNDDWEVKLTGCSMMKDLATCVSTNASDLSHALSPFVFGHAKGDARSQPPELLSSDECLPTAASDLFAFGLVLFEMFTARRAWHNVASDHAVAARVISGARPPIPVRVPPKIRDAIEKCWSPEPAARGNIDDILDLLSIAAHHVTSE